MGTQTRQRLTRAIALLLLTGALCAPSAGAAGQATGFDWETPRLYVIATSHLDTQWRWTVRQTIEEFIPATLHENFALFEKYPDYVFSFEGSFRYALMREYYPEEYERLRGYVRDGRWRVAGSWVDAVDTNVPDPESLIRHVLYGNGFFRREFGRTSRDIFLPDCFGFSATLPSLAAHCGLVGFSTQKLSWGSAVGIPFDIGLWQGIDGSRLICALNPGAYVARIDSDQSADSLWVARAMAQGEASGLFAACRYFGTGDTGGGPTNESVAWVQRSIREGAGPLQVRSVATDQLARDLVIGLDDEQKRDRGWGLATGLRPELFAAAPEGGVGARPPTAEERAVLDRLEHLPLYTGELLMTDHGAGCYTSQSAMKRWNRKNECLADAAERAAVLAHWLGGTVYPREVLRDAWQRFLWHQFHDDLTGTSIPAAYVFSWNDEVLSLNQFASVLTDAVGVVARAMDTQVVGVPLLVYNPLSIEREDLLEAWVDFGAPVPEAVRVYGPDDVEVPSQIIGQEETRLQILLVARVPSIGFAVYDVYAAAGPSALDTGLRASQRSLENRRYRVTVDGSTGDISSIVDKKSGEELLAGPLQLQLLADSPRDWAAWEVDYDDLMAPPREVAGAPAQIRVVENGAARIAMEIVREAAGSTFRQKLSLAAGGAGDRLVVDLDVDWRTAGTVLKASFPLQASAEHATYDLRMGAIQRGTNRPELYEVPAQRWADLSSAEEGRGVAILNDCRYGWDHPDPRTLRLTLLHTPEVNERWGWIEDQATQDLGRHSIRYAVYGHTGDWREGGVPWVADRLNQPLLAFQPPKHPGRLGREFSLLQVEAEVASEDASQFSPHVLADGLPAVAVRAIKLAEESSEIIVRLQELRGDAEAEVRVTFARSPEKVREVNGAEETVQRPLVRRIGGMSAGVAIEAGTLRARLAPYQARALAVAFGPPPVDLPPPASKQVRLPYDLDGISSDDDRTDGDFDDAGHTLSGDLLPKVLVRDGISYQSGPRGPGEANLVACSGQEIGLPEGEFDRLYLLAAAVGGDRAATFEVYAEDEKGMLRTHYFERWIQDYAEPIAQWDSRVLGRELIEDPQQIVPAYIKREPIGWVGTHRHDAQGHNDAYAFTYLFTQRIDLPPGARTLRLPEDPQVRVAAVTVARNENCVTRPAQPLYDECRRTSLRIEAPLRDFVRETHVTLHTPNPRTAIHYTLDGSEPTGESPRYEEALRLTETTTVRARAFGEGMDDSFIASAAFTRLTPREGARVDGSQTQPGLRCAYYEDVDETWENLPVFDSLTPARSVIEPRITIPDYARAEDIGLVFEGLVRIPTEGVYTFHLWSDDGSAMSLGFEPLIDNDGLHGNREKWANVALEEGWHPIRITFFQHKGGASLDLWVEGPGIEGQPVPAEWLYH